MVETYTHGHHQSVVKVHNARSVEDSAAFVLPLLEPHFKLLDVGCGPGSITQGFREYVKEVVGVDSSEDVIAQAKATCGQNVQFEVASVLVAFETRVVLAISLKGDVPTNFKDMTSRLGIEGDFIRVTQPMRFVACKHCRA